MNNGVLIIGVNGLIGSSLAEMAARENVIWTGTSRHPGAIGGHFIRLDLLNDEEIHHLSLRPKISYLCAAETNLRKCESEPLETRTLNVGQTIKLARHLHEAGSEIVFLSSSLVFDGNHPCAPPDLPHSPQTEYGRQKAEVEEILQDELQSVAIVRVTKVVHNQFPLFREWLSALKQGRAIHPFSDMVFCPVDLALVTEELWSLSHTFQPGIFQLSGDCDISYATAARLLAECHGIKVDLVQPQTVAQAQFHHYFPKHTALARKPIRPYRQPQTSFATLERIFPLIV
jgi:dTDP-4-dehydrorhamnose reductase